MCLVSAVFDSSGQIPLQTWDWNTYGQFQKIIQMLQELDKKLGLKDCDDPSKAEILKRIEERLTKLEEAQKPAKAPPEQLELWYCKLHEPGKHTAPIVNWFDGQQEKK